jgi:PKD repeat protein
VPKGVILPPNGTPTARFTVSPTTPTMLSTVTFDASSSTDSDGVIVSYAWTFGDGSAGSGQITQHQYREPGEFVVTLTVTDNGGLPASATSKVTVGESTLPTADFVFSPTSPGLNQDIYFNGATSKAGPGRTLVRYDWHFGSGTPQSGITVVKAYDVAGTYSITLTVTDDVGQTAAASKSLTVGEGSTGLTAKFTYSPTAPTTATTIIFDASDSYSPSGIASYEWDWGDPADPYHGGLGKTATHRYTSPGSYVVRLTVTDTQGRKATTTKTLSISI